MTNSIQLAEPTYNKISRIDLLLGGSVDALIHKNGSFKCKDENIVFRETELGWIVSGSVPQLNCFSTIVSKPTTVGSENLELVLKSLDESLRKFWEIEEVSSKRDLTMEKKLFMNPLQEDFLQDGIWFAYRLKSQILSSLT